MQTRRRTAPPMGAAGRLTGATVVVIDGAALYRRSVCWTVERRW
jgi:hypothetical protein